VSLLEVEGNGATWAYLTRGDRVDLRSGRILPAATSTPLVGTGSAPDPVADVWDSLAPKDPGTYSLVDLAVALVGSAGDTATGSTYEEDPRFTTVLTRVPGTDAWKTAGGTSFSGLQVDITTEQ
jgi:hypothetical protein